MGITKAHSREELVNGVIEAFRFDRKLVIEKGVSIAARSSARYWATTSRRRRRWAKSSATREFYDYEAKYLTDVDHADYSRSPS